MASQYVTIVTRIKARPGLEARVRRELRSLLATPRGQKGGPVKELHASRDDPSEFLLVERWPRGDDLDARLAAPRPKALRAWPEGLLAREPEASLWDCLGSSARARDSRAAAASSRRAARRPDTPEAACGRKLFEPARLAGLELPNRLVRSATWEGLADEHGHVTPALIDFYENLALGGAGLIITGHAHVSPEGQASLGQMSIHDDLALPGLKRLTQAVHAAGGRIALQLAHAGCEAARDITGLEARGPSSLSYPGEPNSSCREMSASEIREMALAFAKGAVRARQAGFDAVQVHAAHGYLLSQFLSPYFNKRVDEYGGSLENRARFLLDVCQLVRDALGDAFPLLVKLNAEDFLEPGLSVDDMIEVSRKLEGLGVAAVELSGGTGRSGKMSPLRKGRIEDPERQAYYARQAARFKAEVGLPLILVGGHRNPRQCERLLADGLADFISMSRPLIREPDLPRRWRLGDEAEAACVSCNRCIAAAIDGKGLRCMALERD